MENLNTNEYLCNKNKKQNRKEKKQQKNNKIKRAKAIQYITTQKHYNDN